MNRIVFDPIKVPGITALKIWLREGSSSDPVGQLGLHQLLCSLLSRGCGPYDNNQTSCLVEGLGASLRSETYEDGILISMKCAVKDVNCLLPLLAWMITDPHLREDQIKLERELSLQALIRHKENPFNLAFDSWRQVAYKDSPYSHDPMGTIEHLKTIGKKELMPIANKLQLQEKVLVISGSIPEDIKEQLNNIELFKCGLNRNEDNDDQRKGEFSINRFTKLNDQQIVLNCQETNQVVMMLGQPTIPYWHPENIYLSLLACHLGCGMSSVLFKQLREKHGLAYEVGVHHPPKEKSSPFLLHASTTENKASSTLKVLSQIWKHAIQVSLTKEELQLAKNKYRGLLAHASQTVSQRAERKAHLLGLKLNENYDEESLEILERITSQELLEVAKKNLTAPLLSLCGPKKSIEEISEDWSF